MDDRIHLISDGDGLTVLGSRKAVEWFLAAEGLWSRSQDLGAQGLGFQGLGPLLRAGAGAAHGLAGIAAESGRWLRLTEESARLVKEFGLTESGTPGVDYAMIGKPGSIRSWLRIEQGPGSLLGNPAVLSGVAGIMAQLALQHEMGEIKGYLARIGAKVDDVLRAQQDAELGKVIGARLDLDSAVRLLEREGQVDDDTWSTVQGRAGTITDALGWVLRRLDALAETVEGATRIGDLAGMTEEVEDQVRELIAVAAFCFELQDAFDVLRLARVGTQTPRRLDGRRLALREDRQERRELVSRMLGHLMAGLDAAAVTAGSHVLLHRSAHRAVVNRINRVGIAVDDFHRLFGREFGRPPLTATRWRDAARELPQLRNAAVEAGRKAAKGAVGVAGVVVVGALVGLAAGAHKEGDGED
ncbi:hypothetical protein ACFRMQ_29615 [Kitasatospora sp. NPDC056783]|uniref:hypothetical protein n=1 Tax=Kitasatospora sp. NPDC056783 TaxID=3345943 RepID=UPI0036BEA21C